MSKSMSTNTYLLIADYKWKQPDIDPQQFDSRIEYMNELKRVREKDMSEIIDNLILELEDMGFSVYGNGKITGTLIIECEDRRACELEKFGTVILDQNSIEIT